MIHIDEKQNHKAALLISITALVASTLFAFVLKNSWDPKTEGIQYDTIGWNMASGRGFSLSDSGRHAPTMVREPAYPFFLAVVYMLFGHNPIAVVLSQIILFILTCLLTYVLGKDIFGEPAAMYAGMLCAISPPLANYPSYLLSETLFTFLVCLAIFCFNRAMGSQKFVWFFASGISLAFIVLCKSIMLLFFFPALAGIVLSRPTGSQILSKKIIIRLIVFSAAFVLAVGLWSYRNSRLFGTYQISLRGGAALWERAERLEKPWKEMGYEIMFDFSEYLGNKMFPRLAENPRDIILIWSRKAYFKDMELKRMGLSPVEIDKTMRNDAIKKIRANPSKFAAYIPMELIKMTAFIYVPVLNEQRVIDWFGRFRHGNTVLSSLRGIFRILAYPLLALAVMGMIYGRRLWRKWFPLLAVMGYINLSYSMLFGMGRYAVPLVPIYSIFASAGFINFIRSKYAYATQEN